MVTVSPFSEIFQTKIKQKGNNKYSGKLLSLLNSWLVCVHLLDYTFQDQNYVKRKQSDTPFYFKSLISCTFIHIKKYKLIISNMIFVFTLMYFSLEK